MRFSAGAGKPRRSFLSAERRRLLAGCVAATAAFAIAAPASASTPNPSSTPASSPSASPTTPTGTPSGTTTSTATAAAPSSAPVAAATASATAQQTGKQVEVAAMTTETELVTANPNGTFTATSSSRPVRVKKNGAWTPIDTTLAKNPDGSLSPKASLAPVTFSPGGTGPAVTVTSPDGKKAVSVSWPGTLPAPQVSGNAALYPDVLPGVDLRLAASGDSYTEVLIVHDAAAAANPALASLKLHMHATGLTLKQGADNTLSGVDANGTEVVHAPQPIMWDSHTDQHAGPTPTADDPGSGIITPLPTNVTTTPTTRSAPTGGTPSSDADLTLAPPASALTGAGITYPEYLDPGFDYYQQYWDEVDNQGEAWWNNSTMNAKVGLCDYSGCTYPWRTMRAYYQMDTHYLAMGNGTHATIYDAHFYITQVWNAANGCTPEPVDLYSAGIINSSTAWPGPLGSYLSQVSSGAGNGCAAASLSFNAQSFVQTAANSWWPNTTFGLRADTESNDLQWKQFNNQAQLSVTYNYPPNTPGSLALTNQVVCNGTVYTPDASPTFQAAATDNNPAPLNLNLWFEMYRGGDDSATNRLSWNTNNTNTPSGGTATWQENMGALGVANWQFRVRDSNTPGSGVPASYSGWSGWYRFTSENETMPTPTITSTDFPKDQYGNAQWGAPQGFGQLTLGNAGNGNTVGYSYAFDSAGAVNAVTQSTCNYSTPLGANGIVPDAGGTATLPIPNTLAPGHHTVWVKSFDAAHNMSANAAAYEFFIAPNYGQSATAHLPVSGNVTNPYLGRCLDDLNRTLSAGATVDVYSCNASPAQTWTLRADGSLVTGDATNGFWCLEAVGSGTANGTAVKLNTCTGAANQQWRAQHDTSGVDWQLQNVNATTASGGTGMCLDDPNASTTNTTAFQLYTCNSSNAQKWSIDLNPNQYEGQDALSSVTAVGGVAASTLGHANPTVQVNIGGVTFAGGNQLWWYGTGADSATAHVTLTIPFATPVEADYALGVRMTSAPDYAQVKFSVDGNALTPANLAGSSGAFDAYAGTCCGATYVPLGGLHLSATTTTPHTLTITVVGRNAANTATYGYGVGLDFLQVAPINNVTFSSFSAAMNNHGISDDASPAAANLDLAYAPAVTDVGTTGTGRSLSKQALSAVGLTQGSAFTLDGINFTMPTANSAGNDNAVAIGQTITLDPAQQIRANAVGLLVASTCGPTPASSGTISYSGGMASDKPITPPIESWIDGSASTATYLPAYYNTPSGKSNAAAKVYLMVLPANPMAPLASVTLPYFGTGMTPGSCPNGLHVLAVGVRPQATGNGVSWIGSWAAAPDAGVTPPGGANFANQTLREMVHPTFLGSGTGVQTRIRFSNRYGTTPLTISAASIAAQTSAGTAATGAATALKFGGAASITIAPGAEAYSDPLTLPDTSTGSGNLAVTVYTSGAVATAPVHTNATTPVWLATGNQTTDTAGAAGTWPTALNAWYFVSAVDVTTNTSQATVAVLGDQNSAAGAPNTWVDGLQTAVANQGATAQGFVNLSSNNPTTVAGAANSIGQRLHNWWRLADGTGTTGADLFGNAPLTMSNTTWSTTDHPSSTSGSAVFNGTSSAGATAATAIDTSQSFTASAWVKMSQTLAGNHEVVSEDSTNTSGFMFGYTGGSNNTWWMYLPGGDVNSAGGPTILANTGAATVGTWTHLTGVYDATGGTMSLYVNGTLAATKSGVSAFKANGPLVVGRAKYNGTATDFWPGSIADVQVFAQALTAPDVALLAAGGGADTQAGNMLNAGVLDEPNLETVVVALGANDISHGDTTAVVEANLKSLIFDVKNGYGIAQSNAPSGTAKVNVVVATVPPMGLAAGDPKEAVRIQLNNDIVANSTNWGAIGYTDPAGATADTTNHNLIKAADLTSGSANANYYTDVANDAASRFAFVWGANAINPAALVAGLSVTPVSGTAPLNVTADASSTAAGAFPISSYTFDFGDGTTPVTQTGTTAGHTYTGAGTFTLTLTVKDSSGATSTATKQVVVSGSGQTAITYAGRVGSNVGTTATTSTAIGVGTAVPAGDALVVSAMLTNQSTGTPTVTDTQGNTYTAVENKADGAKDYTLIFVATSIKALSTTDTITVSYPSTTEHHIAVDAFAGVTTVDQHTSATGTATTFNSGTTATTAAANELVFGVAGVQGGAAATWTSPANALPGLFISGTSGDQLATAYQVVSVTGGYAATGTVGKTWMAAVVTLK